MAEGVDGGGPVEDVEVILGERRVVSELGLEEVEEVGGGEGWGEMGLEEAEELGVVGGRVVGESESGERGGRRWRWCWERGVWDWREWRWWWLFP